MHMLQRPALILPLLALLGACGDDPLPPTGNEGACPITAPTLLAAAPEYFEPQRETYYDLLAIGDELLFTFDRPDDPHRIYWRKNRCGGEPERYGALLPGLHNIIAIDGPEGPILYANDTDNNYFIVDRLTVPGDDPLRRVQGLPPTRMKAYGAYPYAWAEGATYVLFYDLIHDPDRKLREAAGVNSDRSRLYIHAGDPDVPALHLGDAVVQLSLTHDRLLLLHDDGDLERVDPHSGGRERLLSDVRSFSASPDGNLLIWQAMGDGIAEPVYLRRLDSGDDLEIAVNDFNDLAWSPVASSHGIVGTWTWTEDSAAAALLGPDGDLVTAIRADTGAPLDVPEHLQVSHTDNPVSRHEFNLRLPDPDINVEALWNPLTGELRVWYRGPSAGPTLLRLDGDSAEVFVPSPEEYRVGSLHRVDLATGETHELFPQIGRMNRQGEREYITFIEHNFVDEPLLAHYAFHPVDILAIDLDTHRMRRLADDVPTLGNFDDGIVFLDLFSDEPGLRALPRP